MKVNFTFQSYLQSKPKLVLKWVGRIIHANLWCNWMGLDIIQEIVIIKLKHLCFYSQAIDKGRKTLFLPTHFG